MSAVLIAVLAVSVPPAEEPQSSEVAYDGYAELIKPRELTWMEWRDEVTDALRSQALAENVEQPQAVARLISLYQELGAVKNLHRTERSRLQMKVRLRLVRLRDELGHELSKRKQRVENVERLAEKEDRPEKLKSIEKDKAILAQWDDFLGQFGGGIGGGAGGLGGGGAPGGGAGADQGEALVELIQATINPDFWDVNGGPGSIVYWQNLKVLVVSATDEIHEKIGGLNDGLRRAGR